MLRIVLFLATNLAILLVAGVVMNLLGLPHYMAQSGTDLNLTSLLVFCAIFGFAGSFISLLLSKTMAKWSTGTQLITEARSREEAWLLQTVEELARDANIGMPDVGIFPAQQANAFATGWNKDKALVAVSLGLLQRFKPEEVRAVLAHEIGHVANGDMVTLTLIQGVVNTFVMFFARVIGFVVDRVVLKNEEGRGLGFWVTTIVAELVLGILASMIVAAFSRYREYRADAAGASLAGNAAMISALERLKADYGIPEEMPGELTAFCINVGWKKEAMKLFASHPPLDDRIAALRERG
ncbi:MAG: protease HtpX [Gammaproteobacteria bacterium]|nr:MAG: protease HtpX [Gammaproteobacteria bacterium]